MTLENVRKQYEHFCFLASGKFTERDFDQDLGDEAKHIQGKMTQERIALIKSDALRNKEDLERKFPHLFSAEQSKKVKNGDN